MRAKVATQLVLGRITSFGPEHYFIQIVSPRSMATETRAVLARDACLPKDNFAPGDMVYAVIADPEAPGAVVLTRQDPSLPYHVARSEVPEIRQGNIKIMGFACIPGEVATFVLGAGVEGFNVMGAFIGKRGKTINRVSTLSGARFNLVEYENDPSELLKLLIPGFRGTRGEFHIFPAVKCAIAAIPEPALSKLLRKYSYLESLYEQVTGLSLYFCQPAFLGETLEQATHEFEERRLHKRPLLVFISYKWDDETHSQWVEKLATDLRGAGIESILDRWEVRLGDSFTDYMTSKIGSADVVLFVITTRSVEAIEGPSPCGGAVRFEMQMATARRTAGETMRLIGIYREGDKTPAHLRDHRYADFREDAVYKESLQQLVDDLLDRREVPPVGG